jgi:TonB-linked SusC/RagA family outer membrane protein
MRKLLYSIFLMTVGFCALAQQRQISGTVLSEDNKPLPGVTVSNRQTNQKTLTNAAGVYTIMAQPGQVLEFTFVGYATRTVTVSTDQSNLSFTMQLEDKAMDQVVVTALGISRSKRSLGYAAQDVKGADLAQTQRDNFINGLAGRVPGVTISGTSGMPGSSTSIQLRGVNSLSGSNQPLFVIDGLPVNNSTFNANTLVTQTENRTVDFSNRISDLNPEDIESLTILKGPEAAALYGIDAANGAVVITTKKGKAGKGSLNYTFNYGIEEIGNLPEVQHIYNRGTNGTLNLNAINTTYLSPLYFGPKYAEGTTFYDNINNFFRTGRVQKHNISFEGGATGYTYRLSGSYSSREGVVPMTKYDRLNISLSGTAQIFKNFRAETNLQYVNTVNTKVSKGANSFYLALLSFPADVDMRNYITSSGTRSKVTNATSEIENPFFDVNKNQLGDKGHRAISNVSFIYDPLSWLSFTGRVGIDVANTEYRVLYHPESNRAGGVTNGSLNIANQTNRILTLTYYAQGKWNFLQDKLRTTLRVGNAVYDYDDKTFAMYGENFLEPNFNSINNTTVTTQRNKSVFAKKRVIGVFGDFNINYDNFVYLTATGRNDWSSTLPLENRSFFYPSVSTSIVFTELMKSSGFAEKILTMGRIRGSIAQVGKDANPYSTNPALEAQGLTGGGFAYGFTAPNPLLRPEKVTSKEMGMELQFFRNRLSLDVAYYKSKSVDQIINGLRISYGTGFILKNINGGELQNWGTEILLRGTPIQGTNFTWDVSANFTRTNSELTKLPEGVTEYYNSDTWLFGNVRNGARLNGPLTTLTAISTYQYNNKGQLLISPATGLPLTQSFTSWPVAGDRNPDFKMGISNSFTYKGFNLNFLFDIKKGGDVYNATGLYMYILGLHPNTITDRETPRTFNGILKDGLENTDHPTPNNITVIPYYNNAFYSSSVIDQEFIERDVNWVRLRDITLNYQIPSKWLSSRRLFRSASIGVTATDLFMWTNYTGGDPGVNGTTTATGGSGSMGIDYGNLPIPKTYNLNIRIGL